MRQKTACDVNQKLYRIMRDVYAEFTGEELAQVIRVIRQEITAEEDRLRLELEIARLTGLL